VTETFAEQRLRWGLSKALYAGFMSRLGELLGLYVAVLNLRDLSATPAQPNVPDGYQIRILNDADLSLVASQPNLDTTEEFIEQAQQNGDFCAGAFCHGELVSYMWHSYESTPIHPQLVLTFSKPIRYRYKALTLAEHRGLRLQNDIALLTDNADRLKGYTQVLSYINTHNYASLASNQRRGNIAIGRIVWMKNRWLNLAWATPSARKHGIDLRLG